MEEPNLTSIVARLKDDLNTSSAQDEGAVLIVDDNPTSQQLGRSPTSQRFGPNFVRDSPTSLRIGPNSINSDFPGQKSPPASPIPSPLTRSVDDSQQPLLLGAAVGMGGVGGEDERGSQRLGDVEMRIPLRLQKMKEASERERKRVLHRPYFTYFISAVDVIMMIVELIVNKGFTSIKVNMWLGVSIETLVKLGAKYTPFIIYNHQWWRLLTPVFLHLGLGHLILNLLAQIFLGYQLERTLGTPRIIILYFVSAVAGNLCSALFLPLELEVGASTAIYGLASYYLVDLLIHWSLVFTPMRYCLALLAGSIIGIVVGLFPGIDNFAHLGGSAGGFLVSLVLVPRTKEGKSLKYTKVASWVGPPLLLLYFGGGITMLCIANLREEVWRCGWCEYLNCIPIAHWCSPSD